MKISVRQITFTAMLTAITTALCIVKIPLGFANLYLVDVAVCLAGLLLNPFLAFLAFIAGGVGAFLGDLLFYPQAMVVTLITRAVQVIVISIFAHYVKPKKTLVPAIIGCIIGVIIMVAGYCFFAILFYSSIEYAFTKMPFEALQAIVGVIIALPLCFKFRLREILEHYMEK